MNLLQHIKNKRAQQSKKQPLRRNAFSTTSGLVRWYGLDDRFLQALYKAVDYLSEEKLKLVRGRSKVLIEFPLFSLLTKEEYSLTMAIISKVGNPYLQFVQSPEEILLCKFLYSLNPALSPEQLRQYHFETLILHERDNPNFS